MFDPDWPDMTSEECYEAMAPRPDYDRAAVLEKAFPGLDLHFGNRYTIWELAKIAEVVFEAKQAELERKKR